MNRLLIDNLQLIIDKLRLLPNGIQEGGSVPPFFYVYLFEFSTIYLTDWGFIQII